MTLTPHHLGIIVRDLEASTAFYEALGFRTVSTMPSEDKTIRFVELDGLQLEFFCYVETPSAQSADGKVLGFRHLALGTDDVDAELARLVDAGFVVEGTRIREIPGVARLVFFNDPDGVEIELMQAL